MKISYNWLQSFFKQKLPKPEKLAEFLTLHSFETEIISPDFRIPGYSDTLFDVDILPNRAHDCLSHIGVSREISALSGLQLKMPSFKSTTQINTNKNTNIHKLLKVEVKDKELCSRYSALVIENIKIAPSPKWIRERLIAVGIRPINNIVDLTNYITLGLGYPMHAFDLTKIEGRTMIVREAKDAERVVTLDGKEHKLKKGIIVIQDSKKLIDLAGIMGGANSQIDEGTTSVVLQAAVFNPIVIRRASRFLNHSTEASDRYTYGLSPAGTEWALVQALHTLKEMLPGARARQVIDIYPEEFPQKIIKLNLNKAERFLGIKISAKAIIAALTRLEFAIKKDGGNLIVSVPWFRLDIEIPEDLIEEIGRIHGYENIQAVLPVASLIPAKRNLDIFWENMAKDALKEAGFAEVYNYSFISKKDQEIFAYSNSILAELENPISDEARYLRPNLIPGLLKNAARNQEYFPLVKIFEIGKVFGRSLKETKVLTGVITGEAFLEAKGVIDSLCNKLGISQIWYDEYRTPAQDLQISWRHPKRSAEIKINEERIGFLGEISPRILENFGIKSRLVYFDIFFSQLSKLASEEHEYRPISRFPALVRDIAVLVPLETKVGEVLNKIETVGGVLVRDIDLFDMYEGKELPEGKKNLAFHIIFQAEDRTLNSQEIDELVRKIAWRLEQEEGWEVRR